jgi:sodium/hydrogen antiporter
MATRWFLIVGLLLITIGLTDTWRRQLPVATAAIYLLAGHLLGPEVAGFIDLDLVRDAAFLERLTEAAVMISLFAVGLRLRAPLVDPIWRAPLVMATFTMLLTVGLLCAAGVAFGLALGPALLLAAALAPTDPVLASDVQVDHERDRDRLRFSLTAEAGLNDGTAAPLAMLALGLLGVHELGEGGWRWWALDLLWPGIGGLAVGWALGFAFGRYVVWLRREREQALGMESFLTLGLIALTYGVSLLLHVYGFLAVFAAGIAMRQIERQEAPAADAAAYMAKAVLDFTLDLEKLAELVVMIVVGTLLTREAFTPATVGIALVVFLVARPLAVAATTWPLRFSTGQRRLAAWFGIRGVGSMYYLAFAVAHGAVGPQLAWVSDAVLVTITLSVLLHGTTATPVMRLYRRSRRAAP